MKITSQRLWYSQFDIVSVMGRKPHCNARPVSRVDGIRTLQSVAGLHGHRVEESMVQQAHDVGLASTALADEDDGPSGGSGGYGLQGPLHVGRRIRDLQQLRGIGPLRQPEFCWLLSSIADARGCFAEFCASMSTTAVLRLSVIRVLVGASFQRRVGFRATRITSVSAPDSRRSGSADG